MLISVLIDLFTAEGGIFRSIGDMGAVVTGLTLATGVVRANTPASSNKNSNQLKKEYPLVMDTKLKIIEILQVEQIYLEYFIYTLIHTSVFKSKPYLAWLNLVIFLYANMVFYHPPNNLCMESSLLVHTPCFV